ncbi:MAG: DUF2309 family protein [Planctomycetaceae bacterium]|nr:DUF2309 family protein [Planctomycetaceae bacterium]
MTPHHCPTLETPVSSSPTRDRTARLDRLSSVIDHASHWLPAQGPITVFIHHNTLHALEELPFDDAVKRGSRIFGCHPFLPEEDYRRKLAAGRIRPADLEMVLRQDLGARADAPILSLGTRLSLRLAMLEHPFCLGPAAELRWFVAETDALTRIRREASPAARERLLGNTQRWIMRDVRGKIAAPGGAANGSAPPIDPHLRQRMAGLFKHFGEASIERWSSRTWEAFTLQAQWRVCHEGVHGLRPAPVVPSEMIRHRDWLLEATGDDSDSLVQAVMIRFCAPFLDQGFAHWPLPYRALVFFRAFSTLYRQEAGPPDLWLRDLPRELGRLEEAAITPRESILESLEMLGVMDGAASDLRTGLPWQMVEIHEPVRLLFVIESTPARMEAIMQKNPAIGQLCRNGWIQLTVLDPESPAIQVFEGGAFHPYDPLATRLPRVATSTDWYRGCRDHLEYAEITG